MVDLCGCCGAGSHLVVGHHNPGYSGQDLAVDKKRTFKSHLVDWGRGKVDGREVAVLGQRVGCCYLRLKKKGSETFAIYISTALNDRANLRVSLT